MRYLRSSLVAGLVFCTFAPAVVHLVLPDATVREFERVLSRIEGAGPRAADAATNWSHVGMVLALRLGFGFLVMGLLACCRRGRARAPAVARAGLLAFALGYVPLLVWFHWGHGLPLALALLGGAIGLAETMLATWLGAWAAGPD